MDVILSSCNRNRLAASNQPDDGNFPSHRKAWLIDKAICCIFIYLFTTVISSVVSKFFMIPTVHVNASA